MKAKKVRRIIFGTGELRYIVKGGGQFTRTVFYSENLHAAIISKIPKHVIAALNGSVKDDCKIRVVAEIIK